MRPHTNPARRSGRSRRALGLALAVALIVAGCGDGAEPEAEEPETDEADDTDDDEADEPDDSDADDADDELAEHFGGETINFIVGFGPGGAYDTHARLLAEHMAQYIPGEPDIVIQNVPGGVSLNGAREVSLANPDGLTIGIHSSNLDFQHAVGVELPGLDPTELIPLGTAMNVWDSIPITCMRTDVASSFEEALDLGRDVRFAEPSYHPAAAFLEILDIPVQVVLGYDGIASVVQAVDSGEADGSGWCTVETLDNLAPQWIDEESVLPVLYAYDLDLVDGTPNAEWHERTGVPVPPELKDVVDLTDEQLAVLELVTISTVQQTHNITAPPGTPDDIVEVLREAIRRAAESDEYQQALIDNDRPPGYRSPQEIAATVASVQDYPEEVRDTVRQMFED